jgi:hypothetical protein
MTHSDKGHYAAKHGLGASLDKKIAAAVREKAAEGKLACADAERIGIDIGAAGEEIGRTADLLEIRISRCQLGLFGYEPAGRCVQAAEGVAPALEEAIRSRLAGGRLSCAAAWDIAGRMKIPRIQVASACETLKIKIKPCQLGAF